MLVPSRQSRSTIRSVPFHLSSPTTMLMMQSSELRKMLDVMARLDRDGQAATSKAAMQRTRRYRLDEISRLRWMRCTEWGIVLRNVC